MRVFITGGTGFVGRALVQGLLERNDQVTILSRSQTMGSEQAGLTILQGEPSKQGVWQEEVLNHDAVVNLAGSSIFCRWSAQNRERIVGSRIQTTRNLVEAMNVQHCQVKTLVNGSAVGYYGPRLDGDSEVIDENSGAGIGFLARLAQDWEATAYEAAQYGIRVVPARLGVVIGPGGGALSRMIPPFRLGLGSPLGNGRQWFSWISIADLVAALICIIDNREITGPVNCIAPNPVTNKEMTEILARHLGRPLFLPNVPVWLLKLLLGEFSSVFLEGQRVIPKKLLDHGFSFRAPRFDDALKGIF